LKIFKNLLLQNQQAKINQTWYKSSFGEENSNKGPGPLQRGIITEIQEKGGVILKSCS
jgi:hypothetical protein